MKKRLLLSLNFLTLFLISVMAQPGFQGKKLSVNVGLLAAPALINATYSKAPGLLTFNNTKEANIDYVLGRRNTIGITYKNLRSSILRNYDEEYTVISPTKVFSNALGIHYRIFNRKSGNLAPLGKYIQLGANIMSNHTKNITNKNSQDLPFKTYSLSIGAGKNKILFNRIILYYGLELSHVFTKEGLTGATFYYKDDNQTMAQYRLWRHCFVNAKAGLGFLAF